MNINANSKTALVLGATGGIGGEVATQLREAGWQVRALVRNVERVAGRGDGLQWLEGDAMNAADVARAAQGVSVIVHAVNPPGYQRWAELVLPMIDNTIAAARQVGARIVLPGTVYNFGPDALPRLDEQSPQNPLTRKGAIRVEMERRLRAAADQGVRSLIVRAGDFFGPKAGNNWFSQGLVKPGKPVRSVSQPGRAGVGHQWAYLPDAARTMVMLLQREDKLQAFESVHMAGHWDADGSQMVESVRRVVAAATNGPLPGVSRFPWWLLNLASPFVTVFREMKEMRYLWQQPVQMGNTRLLALLGHEPHTPRDEAVRVTLEGLGCLDAAGQAPARLQAR